MAIATDFVGAAAERYWSGLCPSLGSIKVAPKGTNVDNVYEVEQIINHRPEAVGPEALNIEYLVKWTGFNRQDSTWEPGDSLQQGAIDAISDYWSARSPETPTS